MTKWLGCSDRAVCIVLIEESLPAGPKVPIYLTAGKSSSLSINPMFRLSISTLPYQYNYCYYYLVRSICIGFYRGYFYLFPRESFVSVGRNFHFYIYKNGLAEEKREKRKRK